MRDRSIIIFAAILVVTVVIMVVNAIVMVTAITIIQPPRVRLHRCRRYSLLVFSHPFVRLLFPGLASALFHPIIPASLHPP